MSGLHPDLLLRPATELAGLVREGELSATDLVELTLGRIEDLNDTINAFVFVDAEAARSAARDVAAGDPRPFAGVPIALKDLGAPWAGRPLTSGSDLYGDFVPQFDSATVGRIKAAGFIPVGRTNASEFGILPVTEPRRHGPTRNPWDLDRSPGGSSGGSAAAVAAGLVPIAHGSDGGGSIRIPASCCGLVGLKPARGRISLAPLLGDHFLATEGVVTRSVRDTAAALDVLAGYEPGDATWAPPPPAPFHRAVDREPGRLRIATTAVPPLLDAALDPVCANAVHDAAGLLRSLGHEVEEIDPGWQPEWLFTTFTTEWSVLIAMNVRAAAAVSDRQIAEALVEPLTWELWRQGSAVSAVARSEARLKLQSYARSVVGRLAAFDAVLTPALAERPPRTGEINGADRMAGFERSAAFTPFTAVANVTGLPAISLPLYEGADGLPLAVQLIGRPAGEAALLSLSAQVEAAAPWASRRPAPAT